MLEFIKNTILGSRIFNRANSVEVQSKRKDIHDKKRPLSFDSKQKQKTAALKTSKRQIHPQVLVLDETMTIKKMSSYSKDQKNKDSPNFYDPAISDLGSQDRQLQKQMSYPKTFIVLNANPKKQNAQIIKDSNIPQSVINQNNKKILIRKESSKRKIKKIQEKCAICKKALSFNESLQLACTHRYHRTCAIQMQWRMRYSCDVCEMKRDYNKGSIMLRAVSRTRNH